LGGKCHSLPHRDTKVNIHKGFGSDPVLQAFGGALSIEGIQSVGVIATIKHLIANEQEMYRMYNVFQAGISSNLDDRTMHELYLWPFAEGVRSGVGSVMIAYNAVNGSACSQNSYLINGILKDELGFQGFVMVRTVYAHSRTLYSLC
jgi:beta-glucosidase-like glycosyl hydrolase